MDKKIIKATYYECPCCGHAYHNEEAAEHCLEKHTTDWSKIKYAFGTDGSHGGAYGYVEVLDFSNGKVLVKNIANGDETWVRMENITKVHPVNVQDEIDHLEKDIELNKKRVKKMRDVLNSITKP